MGCPGDDDKGSSSSKPKVNPGLGDHGTVPDSALRPMTDEEAEAFRQTTALLRVASRAHSRAESRSGWPAQARETISEAAELRGVLSVKFGYLLMSGYNRNLRTGPTRWL